MISRTNYENNIKKFEIQKDTVYIRSDFREIIDSDGDRMWEYEEKIVPLTSYIEQSYPELENNTSKALAELTTLIFNNQKQIDAAIAELSILIGGAINNV